LRHSQFLPIFNKGLGLGPLAGNCHQGMPLRSW